MIVLYLFCASCTGNNKLEKIIFLKPHWIKPFEFINYQFQQLYSGWGTILCFIMTMLWNYNLWIGHITVTILVPFLSVLFSFYHMYKLDFHLISLFIFYSFKLSYLHKSFTLDWVLVISYKTRTIWWAI